MTKTDIFSGFLGAGKTTLIRKMLNEIYKDEKVVLIENEFGDVGIDGDFLKDAGIEINEMNSGCICCTLVGDFKKSIEQVLEQFKPDRIIIEPSGVGKLSDIIAAAANADESLEISGTITVVDAKKCEMYMKNFGEFFDNQIISANAVILSHVNGLSEAKIARVAGIIRELNEKAAIITTDWEQLDAAQIHEAMEKGDTLSEELAKLAAEAHEHHHDHDHHDHDHDHHDHDHHDDHDHDHHDHHDHDHDHHDHDHHDHHDHDHHDHDHEHHHHDHDGHCCCGHHHDHDADEVFESHGIETNKKFDEKALKDILASLADEKKYGIVLRAKGIVEGQDGWLQFDYVPGEPEVRKSKTAGLTGRLCVIGSQLDADAVEELFLS